MFSPPNPPSVTAWFARLDAAWGRMPADERTRQREEIEQHLEGLVAAKVAQGQPLEAAWEAALVQFGDPTQIGRKIYQEWQQSRTGFRADMKAILFGFGLNWLYAHVFLGFAPMGIIYIFPVKNGHQIAHVAYLVTHYGSIGGALLICVAVGRKYPMQAVRAALYSHLLMTLVGWSQILAYEKWQYNESYSELYSQLIIMAHFLWQLPLWYTAYMIAAYLASVTKRGWYRPTLADFKITLPRRRFKIAR